MNRSPTALICLLFLLSGAWAFLGAQEKATKENQKAEETKEEKDPPHFKVVDDRWRDIEPPPYEINVPKRPWYDPYNKNPLKGDVPIIGEKIFLILTATLDSRGQFVDLPTPSGISTADPGSFDFFGVGERLFNSETLFLNLELYKGNTAFKPRDWEIRIAPAINHNYIRLQENNAVNFNVRKGRSRTDHHIGFQELFVEKHLFDISDRYDFVSVKAGIQKFGSDFRDFIFADYNLGLRFFGSAANNRYQYNLAYFKMLEKDTNSELNTLFDDRDQEVWIANLYRQDTLRLGYTAQVSLHYNRDGASIHFDENGFPARPALVGDGRPHEIQAFYLGWTGDGHFGRLNLTHALYGVTGEDSHNPLAARSVDIRAFMSALELSVDKDWMRFRSSVFYASGDDDPFDDRGEGFDTIVDRSQFGGGPFSFWNQNAFKLLGVNLNSKFSFVPNLRSSNLEGQANFVNPGFFLANLGFDGEWTPKFKSVFNLNYLSFATTETLESFVNQNDIDPAIGFDYSLGLLYRPYLNNNVIIDVSLAGLTPLEGFEDLFESNQTLGSANLAIKLTF